MRSGHKAAAFLHAPTLVTRATTGLEKAMFWVVNYMENARRKPQGPVSGYFPPPSPCRLIPNPYSSAMLMVLWFVGGASLRKEAGGGNTTSRSRGDPVSFHSSSLPAGPPSFGCTRLASAVGGPVWIRRLWSHAEGTRHHRYGGGGLVCWHILPSSLGPVTAQPRDPSLLRLQECHTSPGHRGLRAI